MFSDQERKVFQEGYKNIAGLDEVGRGPLAGPVTAAIVVIDNLSKIKNIPFLNRGKNFYRDSKHLSQKMREEVFEIIKQKPGIKWQISSVWPKTIDKINIWQATLMAWRNCLKKINPKPDFIFLDGQAIIPRLKIKQEAVIKGDQRIKLISLASIIAKVSRDKLMEKLDKKFPQYGLAKHKGYGTKLHLERLKKFGSSEIHRKSCQPVFKSLPFKEKVYYTVSKIPAGETITYQQLAEKIGHSRAYRAVGQILKKNEDSKVPCHRVIYSNGKIGGYKYGWKKKRDILIKEGAI